MTEKQALALLKPIIRACETGQTLPWRKEWKDVAAKGGNPANFFRKTEYNGINTLILLSETEDKGYRSNWWITYKQTKQLGGEIPKGTKATWVVFWKFPEKGETDKDGNPIRRPLCRCYNVFNLDQIQGIDPPEIPELADIPEPERIDSCERIIKGYPNPPTIEYVGNQGYYSGSRDLVRVPEPQQFTSPETFYAVLFHELIHSTGHESRLNRDDLAAKRTKGIQRNREELTAEMGSQLLCHLAKIALAPLEENASAYCAGWGRRLREKPVEFVQAAQRAKNAANHILGKAQTYAKPKPSGGARVVSKPDPAQLSLVA